MRDRIFHKGCFVTGTDTDAGKTTVTAALLRSFCNMGAKAQAIKPVQTGCVPGNGTMIAPDAACCNDALEKTDGNAARALHTFELSCSPHLAARCDSCELDAKSLAEEIRSEMHSGGINLVEGAGGILVPLNERETMLDLMQLLGLPILLVIPDRLGCINHALMSLRVLSLSGLSIMGMILCRTESGDSLSQRENHDFLARRGQELKIPLLCELPFLPELHSDNRQIRLQAWQKLADIAEPAARILMRQTPPQELRAEDDAHYLWHPYAGTEPAPAVRMVESARGTRISLADGRELLDGMSSWWCANLGYGRKDTRQALIGQAMKLPHVMFGGFTHEPALKLARKLAEITPDGLERVFFCDSGSVAVEVALKMAIQYQLALGRSKRKRICAMRGAYHGDTLGAMSVCDPINGMHHIFRDYLPEQIFLPRPKTPFGEKPDEKSLAEMEKILREHGAETAAVIVEPIAQGAGGMWFYHPEYLRRLRILCDELDVLLIADEIATGFGRTGKLFACEWAEISPDIMCLGKAITGGMMSFAATMARERIAGTISRPADPGQPGILLHGPTFMANPLACATALAAVETLLSFPWQENVKRLEKKLSRGLEPCRRMPGVKDVRTLGAIGVVETEKPVDTEKMQKIFVDEGCWIRPFNRLVYVMPPFTASDEEAEQLTGAICRALRKGLHL